jgi:hypothetical protein
VLLGFVLLGFMPDARWLWLVQPPVPRVPCSSPAPNLVASAWLRAWRVGRCRR